MSILTSNFSLTNSYRSFIEKDNLTLLMNHLFVIYCFFIPISNSATTSTFFIILLLFIFRGDYWYHIANALKNKIVLALSFYALLHILWLFGTESFNTASWTLRSSLFYLYPIIFISFLDYRFLHKILSAFFLGMLVSELFSYGLFFHLIPESMSYYNTYKDPTPFFHHTHYGLILAFTLVLIFQDFFLKKENLWTRILLSLFFITASINLFITGGRTGYVLYLVLLISSSFLLFKKQLLKMSIGITILLAFAFSMAYNFSPLFHDRIHTTIITIDKIINQADNFHYTSLGNRIAVWENSLGVIKEHPFGVGTGEHMSAMREYSEQHNPGLLGISNRLFHLHNEYLSILVQFGVIGLLVYLNIFYQIFRYRQENNILRNMQIILAIAIIFFGLIEIVSNKTELSLILFVTFISISSLTLQNQSLKQFPSTLNLKVSSLYFLTATSIFIISTVT